MFYNDNDADSILTYARRLEGKSIGDVNKFFNTYGGKSFNDEVVEAPFKAYRGKGGYGNFLEEAYFGKKNDIASLPDFQAASIELKVSPLTILKKNKEIRVKERLVLNKFTFTDIDKETFETSHFITKDALILLVFYFYDKNKAFDDLKIDLVDLWETLKHDLPQIKRDWETIVNKVRVGKAEEISEGDTLFLGACTKGSTKEASMQVQPHSDVKAPGRALCFKQSYINHIYKILKANSINRQIKESHFLDNSEATFENKINQLFFPYINLPSKEIGKRLGIGFDAKSYLALITRTILGFSKKVKKFYEFEAANIQIKTIRIEARGSIKESMSFKAINYVDILDEEWENSALYQELNRKFIFVIFRQKVKGEDYFLSSVKFWNMPSLDLEVVHGVWEDTKLAIINDDFSHFPKIKDNRISHVRPHAQNSKDVQITPSGRYEYKRSFWLNSNYIKSIIN